MYESLTDSPMNKKLCFCLCMALLAAFVMPEKLRAQRPDFTTWLNVGAEYELKKSGFTLESGLEWRTKDHFRQTDRVGWNVDGSYQLLSWLKVGMGYELHLRNLDEEEWGFRHRYKLQAILSARVWSRLKVSLREKFQHTLDGDEENELRLRTRLKLAYDVPRSPVCAIAADWSSPSSAVGRESCSISTRTSRTRRSTSWEWGASINSEAYSLCRSSAAAGSRKRRESGRVCRS